MTDVQYCSRPDLGVLRFSGADSRRFLHAQTTQDVAALPSTGTALAAWLSAQGRVRALFDLVAVDDTAWLILPADQCDWLSGELARFVLRADVRIDAPEAITVFSMIGETSAWLEASGVAIDEHGAQQDKDIVWIESTPGNLLGIGLSAGFEQRLPDFERLAPAAAITASIAAGRPDLPATLRDRYIPQMLNLDQLGGVSFTKGCYPGQEIVARTANLGTVKRRLRRFRSDGERLPEPGDIIVDADGEAAGEVNRASAFGGVTELLAVVSLDKASGALTLAKDSAKLEALPLPYGD